MMSFLAFKSAALSPCIHLLSSWDWVKIVCVTLPVLLQVLKHVSPCLLSRFDLLRCY